MKLVRSTTARSAVSVALLMMLLGCGDRQPPSFDSIEVAANDNPAAPLAAKVALTTDEPSRIVFEVDDGERQWTVTPSAESAFAVEHRTPLLGLHPDRSHSVVVRAEDAAGNVTRSDVFEVTTPEVPELFPEFEVVVRDPDRMEPGYTFFNLTPQPEEGSVPDYGALAAVDDEGRVVWFYKTDHGATDARHLRNGNVLYQSGRTGLAFEIDMLGNVVRQWHTTGIPKEDVPESSVAVETDTIHHEILEMPSGSLLALSAELRELDD